MNLFRLAETLTARGRWLFVGTIATAVVGFVWGFCTAPYTATVTVSHQAVNSGAAADEKPAETEIEAEKLLRLMRAPAILHRVVTSAAFPVTIHELESNYQVSSGPACGSIQVLLRGAEPRRTVELANLCAKGAVEYATEAISNDYRRLDALFQQQLKAAEHALSQTVNELQQFQANAGVIELDTEAAGYLHERTALELKSRSLNLQLETFDLQIAELVNEISRHHPALLAARQLLDRALLRWTDEHPKVQELKANVAAVEAQLASRGHSVDADVVLNGNSLAQTLYAKVIELRGQKVDLVKQLEQTVLLQQQLEHKLQHLGSNQAAYSRLKCQLEACRQTRDLILTRSTKTRLLASGPANTPHIVAAAAEPARAQLRSGILFGGITGLIAALAAVLVALVDRHYGPIRSSADLQRTANVPLLATLPDLGELSPADQERWALETLLALRQKMTSGPRGAVVCAVTSCGPREGRSTFIRLLANAALKSGHRVAVISAGNEVQLIESPIQQLATSAASLSPDSAMQRFTDSTPPLVRIPVDDGQVRSAAWRRDWREALEKLKSVDDLIVLVDLPPASEGETLLLSEQLGQVIWLCRKRSTSSSQLASRLHAVRRAGGNVVGAVFNERPRRARRKRRRFVAGSCHLLFFGFYFLLQSVLAQEPAQPPTLNPQLSTLNGISVSSPANIADWQKRLTLGPGDTLNISLYEQADTARTGLAIGPDGRLNYLQARDVMAAGLTVDELRQQLETVLLKFYRPPVRVIALPQVFQSKKYFLLGNVVQAGVFRFDGPVTVVEAIARAHGFVSSTQRKTQMVMADLPRSFLMRRDETNGFRRVAVDFDALFLQGDLAQNVALAPDDYLYFPPLNLQEVYVFGDVLRPGSSTYSTGLTVIGALSLHGGFNERAYKKRILIIRGSLSQPQTFVLNVSDVLTAKSLDFKLQARDIIYVSRKPWYKAEELLEAALSDFMRAAVISWTGLNVGPFIKDPILR